MTPIRPLPGPLAGLFPRPSQPFRLAPRGDAETPVTIDPTPTPPSSAPTPAPNSRPSAPPRRSVHIPPMARPVPPPRPGPRFQNTQPPAPKPPLLRPRKVRGGVKVPSGDIAGPTVWAAQRWLRLLEGAAEGAALVEGLEYARAGQTKRLAFLPGRVEASVQGRGDRPYTTLVTLATLTEEQWGRVVAAMAEGAIYTAKLLAGELPPNIEDVFAPLGLRLFPGDPAELAVSCTCTNLPGTPPDALLQPPTGKSFWCKHACCVAYLLAHRLATEPFVMFALRGLDGKELLERLRHKRVAAGGGGGGATPIYAQRVPGVSDIPPKPLDDALATFWDIGPAALDLDLPLTPPVLTHPLLRRLGPSPFLQAQFPLVGLLASCYETISADAIKSAEAEAQPPEHAAIDAETGDGHDGDDE